MDWIRKNPHLLTLIIIALGVAAASAMVVLNAQNFNEQFGEALRDHPQGDKIPALDVSVIDKAQTELSQPAQWVGIKSPDPRAKSLVLPFVPPLYTIDKDGKPARAGDTSHHNDRLTGQPIPDRWFLDNNLSVTELNAEAKDPDGDGFFNDDEWRAGTNPQNKESHPAYYTQLYVKQVLRYPFRLRFNGYDGEPAKPETMTFQINTLDLKQPSEFLKVGDMIGKTKYKIIKFESKTSINKSTDTEEDSSLLTVLNIETGVPVDLVYRQIVNSPDVYVTFAYFWNKPYGTSLDFNVKNKGKFVLLPEKELFYEVLDIKDDQTLIKLPSGEQQAIGPIPAALRPKTTAP